MNSKPINFRTKTHTKSKSTSLSQQFVKIQRVLSQYEKKKFHPKIENFQYMSSQILPNNSNKRKFLLKKDKETFSSEKVFGPLPDVFIKQKTYLKTQKSYDITQITLASSEEKQTYVKMSKIRNPEKRRKLKQAYPKYSEKYIETVNKNIIQLLGKQMDYTNSPSSRQDFSNDEKIFADFPKERNLFETKTQTHGEPLCKKYAQIQIEQFLEDNTNLTKSQKRRITEYNKRKEISYQLSPCDSTLKRGTRNYRKEKTFSTVHESIDSVKNIKPDLPLYNISSYEEEPIEFSSKRWLIVQNNDSNKITI